MGLFKNGSYCVRADFHLHTIKDKEFKFGKNEKYIRRKKCLS